MNEGRWGVTLAGRSCEEDSAVTKNGIRLESIDKQQHSNRKHTSLPKSELKM